MILVLFALSALMTFATLTGKVVIFTYLLLVLIPVRIIFLFNTL
jgi:hypothetical protein